ncbi:MAG: hypothetical protein EXR77_17050 [Myxococcales bacterium]|nr:hypothetical protein [Myxococcales bacterium]
MFYRVILVLAAVALTACGEEAAVIAGSPIDTGATADGTTLIGDGAARGVDTALPDGSMETAADTAPDVTTPDSGDGLATMPLDCGSQCVTDNDCPSKGLGPCAYAVCKACQCIAIALPAGATCSDGLACTSGDSCDAKGACTGGVDPKACTFADYGKHPSCATLTCQDGADGKTKCLFAELTATCNDDSACTASDTCQFGACLGNPLACDDGNPCTLDSCAKASGCLHEPVTTVTACSDGDTCTQNDACAAGKCAPGAALDCGDANPCTQDGCDPKVGCTHPPAAGPCSDSNACTSGDVCAGGACLPGAATVCDDANPCTGDACNPASGCVHPANTVACDDGSLCTQGDQCQAGACAAGKPLSCGDGNPCTDDSCDAKAGCVHVANGAPCSDANLCTEDDGCSQSACAPGKAKPCDDGNPCTSDGCDPTLGCQPVANTQPCDDGSACTQGDACSSSACTAGKPMDCDDGNACSDDSCAAKAGCVHLPNAATCDDGNACSGGDQCKAGACKPGKPPACDDSNPCTTDTCAADQGCGSAPNTLPCSDGSVCTLGDQCAAGQCAAGKPTSCNDGNPCTDDACDPKAGCVHVPNSATCSDGSACTANDGCAQAACAGTAVDCDDANPCTADACAPASGCSHKALSQACDDGSACTVADQCQSGACVPGKLLACTDANPCTVDSCDSKLGCLHLPATATCTDGNLCTVGDGCSGGACLPGAATTCDDGQTCTVHWCDPAKGCQALAIPGPCDDGTACTNGDACSGGTCSGKPLVCDDGDACSADSCDSKTGCTYSAAADGTPCGGTGTCSSGKCSLGTAPNPAPSCLAILKAAPKSPSGAYWLDPNKTGAFQAYCDMVSEGGGWTSLVHLTPIAKLNFSVPHTERAVAQGAQFWVLGPQKDAKYAVIAYLGRPSAAVQATAPSPTQTGWQWHGQAWPNPGGCHAVQELILNQSESEAPRSYGNPAYNPGQAMPAAVVGSANKADSAIGVAKVVNYPAVHIGCVGWNVLKDPVVWVR